MRGSNGCPLRDSGTDLCGSGQAVAWTGCGKARTGLRVFGKEFEAVAQGSSAWKRRVPGMEVSSVTLTPRASKARRNSSRLVAAKAG